MNKSAALDYLLNHLPRAKPVKYVRLGEDITLRVRMRLGEKVVIYVEDALPSAAVLKARFEKNTFSDLHTLVLLAQDVLPRHGATVDQPSEALRLLAAVYGDKVYAYRSLGHTVVVFPVFFEAGGRVIHGAPVDLADLSCDYTLVHSGPLDGVCGIANFDRRYYNAEDSTFHPVRVNPLQAYYDTLEVACDASAEAVKRAYREKAQQNHPDRDPSPDATLRMQRINEAYQEIMKRLK
jgi:hypothetical protein